MALLRSSHHFSVNLDFYATKVASYISFPANEAEIRFLQTNYLLRHLPHDPTPIGPQGVACVPSVCCQKQGERVAVSHIFWFYSDQCAVGPLFGQLKLLCNWSCVIHFVSCKMRHPLPLMPFRFWVLFPVCACMCVCLRACMYVYMCICLSFSPSPSFGLSVCLSLYFSIVLSLCRSLCVTSPCLFKRKIRHPPSRVSFRGQREGLLRVVFCSFFVDGRHLDAENPRHCHRSVIRSLPAN